MANKLVTCETCPSMILEALIQTVQTPKGPMKVCKKCALEYKTAIESKIEVVESSPVTEPKEVTAYLQQVSHVSNPESVPHPNKPTEKYTQSQLFAEYLQGIQVKIADLFDETQPGWNAGIAYSKLEAMIQLRESIVFQAKTEASELTKKQRELDAKSGKNRWDKERRGEDKSNLVDPRDKHYDSRKGKDKRSILTKVEGIVKAMLDQGDTENDIIDMLTSTNKFKGIEIREAIEKFKVGS